MFCKRHTHTHTRIGHVLQKTHTLTHTSSYTPAHTHTHTYTLTHTQNTRTQFHPNTRTRTTQSTEIAQTSSRLRKQDVAVCCSVLQYHQKQHVVM